MTYTTAWREVTTVTLEHGLVSVLCHMQTVYFLRLTSEKLQPSFTTGYCISPSMSIDLMAVLVQNIVIGSPKELRKRRKATFDRTS